MAGIGLLERILEKELKWNRARIKFVARFIVALIQVRTVNLVEIANVFEGWALTESNYKRIQRFLRMFEMPYEGVAKCLVGLLGEPGPWVLTVDRTDWRLGKSPINILMLGIVYRGVAFPVVWKVLGKKGSSNTRERKELMQRFLKIFPEKSIWFVCGDREFIGKGWIGWLKRKKINFRIRIRNNTQLTNWNGKIVTAKTLFADLPVQQGRAMAIAYKAFGERVWVSGMRLADGDYLIVVAPTGGGTALEEYALRWEIETLFGCLKSRGFRLEETHLLHPERLEKLLVLVAFAFCWAHRIGEWLVEATPLKVKKHGRLARSIFRTGFDHLRRILCSFKGIRQLKALKQVALILSCT